MIVQNPQVTVPYNRRAQGLAQGTIDFYTKKLKKFLGWCERENITDMDTVTGDTIRRFIVWLQDKHNPGGVAAFIKTLRAFFNWYEQETDNPSPMKRVRTPAVRPEPLDPADIDDIRRMLAVAGVRDKAILLVLLDTGMRAAELLDLNADDVNLITGAVFIRRGKGGQPRTVYIGRRTRQALRRYVRHSGALIQTDEGERMTYSGLRMIIHRRAKDAGVPPPALHGFRRLFALTMLRAGVDIYSLQLLMGHADIQVLRRYLKLTHQDAWAAHVKGSPVDRLT